MPGPLPAPSGPLTGLTVVASTVQAPGGSDPVRALGGPRKMVSGRALWQKFVHANMLQVTVNLKHASGKQVFRRLLERAEVFIENNRPGAMDRLGFPDAELRLSRPALVITHISGYGRTGPLSGQAGYGTALGALSGYPNLNGHPETGPTFMPDDELGELLMPSAPARISTGGEVVFAGQPAGLHTDEVLRELGYEAGEIAALRREGAI